MSGSRSRGLGINHASMAGEGIGTELLWGRGGWGFTKARLAFLQAFVQYVNCPSGYQWTRNRLGREISLGKRLVVYKHLENFPDTPTLDPHPHPPSPKLLQCRMVGARWHELARVPQHCTESAATPAKGVARVGTRAQTLHGKRGSGRPSQYSTLARGLASTAHARERIVWSSTAYLEGCLRSPGPVCSALSAQCCGTRASACQSGASWLLECQHGGGAFLAALSVQCCGTRASACQCGKRAAGSPS
jgi:hypothetical protein